MKGDQSSATGMSDDQPGRHGVGRESAGGARRAAAPVPGGRDRIDGVADAWEAEMPPLGRSELEMVKRAVRLSSVLEDALLDCLEPWQLTKGEYNVLSTLRSVGEPYELRPSDLRARLLLSSGGVSKVLGRLGKDGLVARERDSADGRSAWVRLTPAGVRLADETVTAWHDRQRAVFRSLPADVSRTAADALRDVLIALGDVEPPHPGTRSAVR